MSHAPRAHLRAALVSAFIFIGAALVLTWTAGCRKEAPPAPPSEDAAERAKKAHGLFVQASVAMIPEKYELLKRLMAVYDDTPRGQDAYLELVVLLVRDKPPQMEEALRIARTFRDRHPTDVRVGEAFLQIVDMSYGLGEDAPRKAALDDWSKHLEARDVAGDVPKPALYYDFVRLRLRQERWKDADVAIDTALAEEGLRPEDRVELLVRKGNLLAEKLGDVAGGRAAFAKALDLAKKQLAADGSARSIAPEQIQAEIKKLDGR